MAGDPDRTEKRRYRARPHLSGADRRSRRGPQACARGLCEGARERIARRRLLAGPLCLFRCFLALWSGVFSVRFAEFAAMIHSVLFGEPLFLRGRTKVLDDATVPLDDDIAAACHGEGLFQFSKMV